MAKKTFLIPIAVAVTTLLGATENNEVKAATEKTNKVVINEKDNDLLLMNPVYDQELMYIMGHSSHASHASHGSHGSHSSHYSGN